MQEWLITTLGDEFKIVMGQSPASEYYNDRGQGLPFFQGKKEFGDLYPKIEVWTTQATKKADKGDVLLSVRAPIGDVNIAPQECGIGRGLAAIKPNDKTCSKFIFYLLKAKENELKKKGAGVTFSAITKPNLFSLPIRVPQEKQGRDEVVQAIETQFTRLDAAIKSLKAIKLKLGLYRKSVLKAAFNGGLVQIDGNWIKTTLSPEFEIVMGQSPESKHYNQSGEGLPFFQGKKEFTDLYAEVQTWSREATKIAEKDDVLLSIRAPIGPVNLAPAKSGIGRGLAAVKPNAKTSSKLILYLLQSLGVELEKRGTGTTFRAITKPRLYSLPIRIPIYKEDRDRVLAEIEARFSVIDKIEEVIDASLTKTEKLRKSILKSAFEGKLI